MDSIERAAWLLWRRSGLGGSDIAPILGLSPWRGQWEVWASKVYAQAEAEDRPELTRGRRLEAAVLAWMAADIGGALEPTPPAPATGPEPWMLASPDWYLLRPAREGLEAKTSRDKPWDEVPIGYELQCRWYMACTGRAVWHLGCYFPRHDDWRRWTIARDLDVEIAMVGRAREWWDAHIVRGQPPALDGSSAARRYLRDTYPPRDDIALGGADAERLVMRYQALSAQIAAASSERDEVGAELRAAIGAAAGLRGEGWSVRWSRYDAARVDTARLRAELPDVAAKYSRTTPADRLDVRVGR